MNRRYLLPATIAALLHAGLLCGSRSAPMGTLGIRHIYGVDPKFDPPPPALVSTDLITEGVPREETVIVATEVEASRRRVEPRDFVVDLPVLSVPEWIRCPICPPLLITEPRWISSCETIYEASDLYRLPRVLSQAVPIYPFESRSGPELAGEVLVEFIVDESGAVVSPQARRSSGEAYSKSALAAVAHWKFEPGMRGGRPVRFRMGVPIGFTLTDEP